MDRGAWQPIVYGIAESDMTERLMLSLSQQFSPELSNIVFFFICWSFMDVYLDIFTSQDNDGWYELVANLGHNG